MSNPSWLEKLSLGELQLLRDLADVVKRTARNGRQQMMTTAEIRIEIERRGKNNIISNGDAGKALAEEYERGWQA